MLPGGNSKPSDGWPYDPHGGTIWQSIRQQHPDDCVRIAACVLYQAHHTSAGRRAPDLDALPEAEKARWMQRAARMMEGR